MSGKRSTRHSLVLVLRESKWYSVKEDSPQGIWDKIAEKMLLEFAESGCPIRLHYPEVNSKAKDMVNCRFTLQPFRKRLRLFFASANQLSLYGAVAEMCEEYETLHDRSGRLDVVMDNQLCSVRSRQKFFWRMMIQQIKIFYWKNMENELKSYHNKTN